MNLAMNSINPAFSGTMLIPYTELQKKENTSNETMRQIGRETAKFAKPEDMQVTKDGILVKVDDNKEKEYQAVIAKYGINIQKVNTPISKNDNADLSTYTFMVTKLDPQNAKAKADKYAQMKEPDKSKEFLNVYNQFKQSPYATEKIAAK